MNYNSLVLAYIGDSVYETYIRKYLVEKGIAKVNDLQREAVKFVSAKGQARILKQLMDNNELTEEEIIIIKRARNHKSHKQPKNTDIVTYKYSTGFEALIGYLYLNNDIIRLEEIINKIKEDIC